MFNHMKVNSGKAVFIAMMSLLTLGQSNAFADDGRDGGDVGNGGGHLPMSSNDSQASGYIQLKPQSVFELGTGVVSTSTSDALRAVIEVNFQGIDGSTMIRYFQSSGRVEIDQNGKIQAGELKIVPFAVPVELGRGWAKGRATAGFGRIDVRANRNMGSSYRATIEAAEVDFSADRTSDGMLFRGTMGVLGLTLDRALNGGSDIEFSAVSLKLSSDIVMNVTDGLGVIAGFDVDASIGTINILRHDLAGFLGLDFKNGSFLFRSGGRSMQGGALPADNNETYAAFVLKIKM